MAARPVIWIQIPIKKKEKTKNYGSRNWSLPPLAGFLIASQLSSFIFYFFYVDWQSDATRNPASTLRENIQNFERLGPNIISIILLSLRDWAEFKVLCASRLFSRSGQVVTGPKVWAGHEVTERRSLLRSRSPSVLLSLPVSLFFLFFGCPVHGL